MTLTTQERLLVASALRTRSDDCRANANSAKYRKQYREHMMLRANDYVRLAAAFAEHTRVELTT